MSRLTPDLFEPVRTARTVENVMEQILDRLRGGLLAEGDFLPSERTLADAMAVSRRTIRAAVRALVDAGVVEVLSGSSGGIRIRSIWLPEELALQSAALRADEIFEILEARRTLEPRMAQLAAARGQDDHFGAMRRSIELQWQHRDDRSRVIQMNALFHRSMWRAAANEPLEHAMKLIYRKLEIALDMTVRTPDDTVRSIEIHERTLTALMRGDPDEVDAVMDEHMSYLEEISESVLGRRRLRPLPEFLRLREPSR
jgi:DNA-binding FadR family transcriptional regulator